MRSSTLSKCRVDNLLILILLFGGGPSLLVGQEKSAVVPLGIVVAKDIPSNKFKMAAIPGMSAGTGVYLLITMENTSIIEIAEQEPPQIVDDQGTNLSAKARRGGGDLQYSTQISDDRKSCVLPVEAPGFPAANATSLHVTGEIKLTCGSSTKEALVSGEVKKDAKFQMGSIAARIERASPGFEQGSCRVTFHAEQSFATIKKVAAVNKDGKEVEGSEAGSGQFGFNNKRTFSKSIEFGMPQKQISGFKVVYYDSPKSVVIPIDVKTGLGLSGSPVGGSK